MSAPFFYKLEQAITKNNSLLCVGLDSASQKVKDLGFSRQFDFNRKIIEGTKDLVCAYKPNSAFYEASGATGIQCLKDTCDFIRNFCPDVPIILDFKRGDIGSTNDGYVEFAYEYLKADAVTLHTYLGRQALEPFLDIKEKGCFLLCKTSNPGSGEFQNMVCGGESLYLQVAKSIESDWNRYNNCGIVAGATYPEELREIRKVVGDMYLLVPGVGAQGGSVSDVLTNGLNSKGSGLIINSSRGIIFSKCPRDEALKLRDQINEHRGKVTS